VLTLIACLALSSAPMADAPPYAAELDALFAATTQPSDNSPPPGVLWRWVLTPPLPTAWPVTPKAKLVRHVYAHGQDMMLRDGVRVAAPWAVVDVTTTKPKVARLSDAVKPIGTQGVRPLTKDEVAVQQQPSTDSALRRSDLAAVRARYCLWLKTSGVIAQHVQAQHQAFFDALKCP